MYVRGYLQSSENGRVVTIVRRPPPALLRSLRIIFFEKESISISLLLMFGCKCVSVTAIISNSSVKLLRKSNLFRALRIFMLHIDFELSLE